MHGVSCVQAQNREINLESVIIAVLEEEDSKQKPSLLSFVPSSVVCCLLFVSVTFSSRRVGLRLSNSSTVMPSRLIIPDYVGLKCLFLSQLQLGDSFVPPPPFPLPPCREISIQVSSQLKPKNLVSVRSCRSTEVVVLLVSCRLCQRGFL